MFRTLLIYKLEDRGKFLLKVDKWFTTSKICSSCGAKKDLLLSDRIYKYICYDLEIERDYNASLNLKTVG